MLRAGDDWTLGLATVRALDALADARKRFAPAFPACGR